MKWELSYRGQSGWEKVDDWVVEGQMSRYGGNILACPVGNLVVVARADGSLVFVRDQAGQWKTVRMEILEREPFPGVDTSRTDTSLDTPAIQKLREKMSVEPGRSARPSLGQFLPATRELWLDYLNAADRRFRLRFVLRADGGKFDFRDMEERPFTRSSDTSGPPFFIFAPDKAVSGACNRIELFR